MSKFNLLDPLNQIDPASLSYQEWVDVGMALKVEGYTAHDWEEWSASDSRHKSGECYIKWDTFQDTGITGATITQMAKDHGWQSKRSNIQGGALSWDSVISDELRIVDDAWIEDKEVHEPVNWKPHEEVIQYLNTLFDSNDYVGYVTSTYETGDGKHLPSKGIYSKTAGQIIEDIKKYGDDLGAALGDTDPEAGAWVRFNPLDGEGVKNDNVTDFRYALVESDKTEIARQNSLLRELELPIAMLVHSGGRSLHAIVRIDANSLPQYKERVNHLYTVCQRNGLEVDTQNKNPSRLSRLPGIMRNGKKQFIVDTNIGKPSYEEWSEWIEEVNDDLPDPAPLSDVWNSMPEKAPELIEGVLRQGHKLLFAGPSKAGKSFALIELAIAIAEGTRWLGWQCTQGRVLYVNLELDDASGYHRFKDVYTSLGLHPYNIQNIDIWNLRGKTAPLDKLAPKLIRRAEKKGYIAVIIDPIYKVLTGDENSAEDMAAFTNQFDKIATSLKTAVIYAHHHSKGAQGGKHSMDRASGSGVFARDPDAILDLIELDVNEGIRNQQADRAVCDEIVRWFKQYNPGYFDTWVSRDDQLSVVAMDNHAKQGLKDYQQQLAIATLEAGQRAKKKSAWRVEGTLREFEKFAPVDMWFEYPTHNVDDSGILKQVQPESESAPWQKKGSKKNQDNKEERKRQRMESLEVTFDELAEDGKISIEALAEGLGLKDRATRDRVKEHPDFKIEQGLVVEIEDA